MATCSYRCKAGNTLLNILNIYTFRRGDVMWVITCEMLLYQLWAWFVHEYISKSAELHTYKTEALLYFSKILVHCLKMISWCMIALISSACIVTARVTVGTAKSSELMSADFGKGSGEAEKNVVPWTNFSGSTTKGGMYGRSRRRRPAFRG